MYPYYSQNDRRWANARFSDARLRIGDYGCLLTAVASAGTWMMKKMKRQGELTPDEVANDSSRFTPSGLLIWSRLPGPTKFVRRYYSYNKAKALEILKSDWNVCFLQVQWGRQSHWVTVVGWRNGEPVIHDPWDGKRKSLKSAPFSAVTGMAEITCNK